jgi:hypothetical protein
VASRVCRSGQHARDDRPKKAFGRLNQLYDSGRLQQAVGQNQSEQLIQHADAAFLRQQKIANRVKTLKNVAKVAGASGIGYEAVKGALGGSE